MADYLTLDDLQQLTLVEKDVQLDGIGTVRIKALSQAEALAMNKEGTNDLDVVIAGLVEPKLGDDAREWLARLAVGVIYQLAREIANLSGLDKEFLPQG